jgi:hypothetical protein
MNFKSLCILLLIPVSVMAGVSNDVNLLQVRVGRPTLTLGPAGNIVDNFFNSIKFNNSFLCFTANSTSYQMTGTSLMCGNSSLIAKLTAVANGYADCGLWVNDTLISPTNSKNIYALAHAETACNYSIGQTHKSMTITESTDSGKTWTLLGQIITGTDAPTSGQTTGEGDCTGVLGSDNYYYLYCLRDSDYKTIVARAPATAPPISGTWKKYYNGAWTSPGLGGNATALTAYGAASRWLEKDYTMLLSSPSGNSGIIASFSSNHINFFSLTDPLLISDNSSWTRSANSTELLAYVSVLGEQGGRIWSNGQFMMTYMYLEPGANFGSRYLVNRNVTVTLGKIINNGSTPQVGVELSRWLNSSTNPQGFWTTTAAVPGAFSYYDKLGYMMTRAMTGAAAPKTVAIEECQGNWQGTIDHVITPNGTCVNAGYTRLRTLGWLYQSHQPNTTALYRCWSPSKYKSHFASIDSSCEGETTEYILGYILTQ